MAEAYRLYAGTQAGMILFRGVGDIWTSMGGSREFEPYFKEQVVDCVYGCKNSPEIVFAGVTFDGLYRTKDAGRHWQRTLEGDIRWVTVDRPTIASFMLELSRFISIVARMAAIPGRSSGP